MMHTCLFWCLWKEKNDRNFKDRERSLEEILSLFYDTLYLWTVAFVSPLSLSYSDFLFVLLFLVGCSFCILSMYLGASYAFNEISLLLIKKELWWFHFCI
jgi:hypothetical protein